MILRCAFFFTICLFANVVSAQSTLALRTADTQPADYPTSLALKFMGERLAELSNQNLTLKIYSGGQLGEEKDTLEITIFGGIDINRINMAPLNSVIPETSVLGLPFLFRSVEHMRQVVDGEIGQKILASFDNYGLIGLAFYDSGARSFYNSKKIIRTPRDMHGLKIRVQNSPLAIAMVKALGANPTPMGFGQVYESLLLGTIDGSENNWPSYESTGHYLVAKHYSLTRHTMMPEVLVMSKHRWQKLTQQQQMWVRQAAKDSVPVMRSYWDARVAASKAKVIAEGNTIIEDIDQEAFSNAMRPVYKTFAASPSVQKLVADIQQFKVSGDTGL